MRRIDLSKIIEIRGLLSSKGAIRGVVVLGLWLSITVALWMFGTPLSRSAPIGQPSLPSVLSDLKASQVELTAEDIEVQKVIEIMSYWTSILEQRAPEYVWGASDPDVWTFDTKKQANRKGVDCSGSIFWICRKSGLPFPRVTAYKMYMGMGWPGYVVDNWRDAAFPDLLFFTFTSDRLAGHVGIVKSLNPIVPSLTFSEASSKANKFKRTVMTVKSYHDQHFQGIRVLDLTGKPKGPRKEPPRGVK